MDQSTHEIRRRNWMNIINQCKNRPADITAKQWLADNGISDKSYYYWLRKIRLEAYEQLNVPAVTQSAEVSFAEIPLSTNEDHSSDWNESVSTPVAVIKCGNLSIGLSNDISEELLHRLLKEASHAGRCLYWSSFLVTLCSEIMLYIETPLVSYSYSLNEVSHSCTS